MLKTSKLTVLALVLATVASTATTIVLMEQQQQTAFALAKIINNNNPLAHSSTRVPSSATYAHSSGHLTSSIVVNPPFHSEGGHLAIEQDLNPTDG